jgi:cyclopropane fatty-acyl-phospholipid synthase-like methyltransferase
MSPTSVLYDQIAHTYRDSRPSPPPDLIEYLASLAPARDLAWDCGTGNGQVAVALAGRFERVIATDIAAEQLVRAMPRSNVEYRLATAEHSSIPARSVDLTVAGQAAHWFAHNDFFSEVNRVSRPSAAIAFWCYRTPKVAPGIDKLVEELYSSPRLAGHWPPEKAFVDRGYRDLPFPFREIRPREFTMVSERWGWARFESYIRTWQAIHAVASAPDGAAYVTEAMARLARLWGDPGQLRDVRWNLCLRVGFAPGQRST